VLLHGGRIHFTGGFATTKMACPEMTVESGFLAALSRIDNYSVSGDKLSLNRARMAPLLVFERVADVN
jgi:heat shock protein HslJ